MRPLSTFSTRSTPQAEQADERQVRNSAGGYTFVLSPLDTLRRFLILGSDSGTYYVSPQALTEKNGKAIVALADGDEQTAHAALHLVVEVSTHGLAPKNDQALFALAILSASRHDNVRAEALRALPLVARTGTHLFMFMGFMEQFRGWGRAARRAVADWYTGRPADDLAVQVLKYRNREGWTHRDALRVAHPTPTTAGHQAVLRYAAGKGLEPKFGGPAILDAYQALQDPDLPLASALTIISGHPITWEMLPPHLADSAEVWGALVDKGMPITALIRNLPRLTRYDLLKGARLREVVDRITDQSVLTAGRVHPMQVLLALTTYASGRSVRGSGFWSPVRQVVDALDSAFYASFGNVEPTGKRTLLALDVSGSMGSTIANTHLSAREGSVAMAMITAATERDWEIVGFTSGGRSSRLSSAALTPLDVSPRRRLDDNVRTVSNLPFGGTDCSLPMTWAGERSREFDAFVVYTDSETWAGRVHPHQALIEYRRQSGIDARLVVVGMTATEFTIADPSDAGMLDVVGFDASAPGIMSRFIKGQG